MELEIDHEGPVPVYRQLVDSIRAAIESGEFQPGRPIPSVVQLVQTYGVARGTALKALRVLVDEGLVEIVQGRGAYVTRR
ncbi:GntR family transcriptional regulator [Asanoa iriomotensis]|uniref:HTH gntR-type domain-containing protein n=1 Tax=Asanoa iriomotensis TaxID=234613 RepID=A0ABQ4BUN9_9ACTN|nr:winged helix-turn-helix domain-containing protein [Asanoa iriomotensis]GIF54239.1 hypothetical protein Air01nite_03340 [Asanoa iriomotensis]